MSPVQAKFVPNISIERQSQGDFLAIEFLVKSVQGNIQSGSNGLLMVRNGGI